MAFPEKFQKFRFTVKNETFYEVRIHGSLIGCKMHELVALLSEETK